MKQMIALSLLFLYTVCEYTAYAPQIIKLVKTKSANDLSISTWLQWVVAGICYLAYVILETPEPGVIFIAATNLVFIITVCVLTMHYQKRTNAPKTKRKGNLHIRS